MTPNPPKDQLGVDRMVVSGGAVSPENRSNKASPHTHAELLKLLAAEREETKRLRELAESTDAALRKPIRFLLQCWLRWPPGHAWSDLPGCKVCRRCGVLR